MTKPLWFSSDLHLGQQSILTFKDNEGKPLRPFSTLEEMHDVIVARHNSVVGPHDTWYCLGDVVIHNKKGFPVLGRMNGRKILIKGNHCIFKLKDYAPYFEDIRAYKIFPTYGLICSHMPIHPNQLERRWKANVHGHSHSNHVMISEHTTRTTNTEGGQLTEFITNPIRDIRYVNICVEQTNYTPISFEEVLTRANLNVTV